MCLRVSVSAIVTFDNFDWLVLLFESRFLRLVVCRISRGVQHGSLLLVGVLTWKELLLLVPQNEARLLHRGRAGLCVRACHINYFKMFIKHLSRLLVGKSGESKHQLSLHI